jgi:hypothetical protein
MEITAAQFKRIEPLLPVQRSNVQHQQLVRIKIEAVSPDSAIVEVHPDGTGAPERVASNPSGDLTVDGPRRFMWLLRSLERL